MKFLSTSLLVLIGLLVVAFAIANRGSVVLSFDPLPLILETSIFAVGFFALCIGVAMGGLAVWLSHSEMRAEARRLRTRLAVYEGKNAKGS